MNESATYIPPLRFHVLTRFYDAVVRWATREAEVKARVVDAALPAEAILDLGTGTGTLAMLLKARCPEARVVGLDLDRRALSIAREKLLDAGLDVELAEGDVCDPPFAAATFDCVVASLLFHHLTADRKVEALRAARRLLCPGGKLVIADWTKPRNPVQRLRFLAVQVLDGFETTRDHVAGRFPDFLREAGFSAVRESDPIATPLGTIALFRAEP